MSLVWEHVGQIGVDAGLCMVGDPSYVLHRGKEVGDTKGCPVSPLSPEFGRHWHDFCDKVASRVHGDQLFDFKGTPLPPGFAQVGNGFAVVTSTGFGDGVYPVYVRKDVEGRVEAVKVIFIPRRKK